MIWQLKSVFQKSLEFVTSVNIPELMYIITQKVYLWRKVNNTSDESRESCFLVKLLLFTLIDKVKLDISI